VPNYCIPSCDQEQKAAFADSIYNLTQLTWAQIRQQPRHGLGSEKILRHEVKRPIPAHITEDITPLAFRFWGRAPMVGYRMEKVFYVVWLDKNFDLYDHN